jgi:hypothetical protein
VQWWQWLTRWRRPRAVDDPVDTALRALRVNTAVQRSTNAVRDAATIRREQEHLAARLERLEAEAALRQRWRQGRGDGG